MLKRYPRSTLSAPSFFKDINGDFTNWANAMAKKANACMKIYNIIVFEILIAVTISSLLNARVQSR